MIGRAEVRAGAAAPLQEASRQVEFPPDAMRIF
jgi:hypothetical protein